MSDFKGYKVIVIGASSGGIDTLSRLLPELVTKTNLPIVVVLHRGIDNDVSLINLFKQQFNLNVKTANEREPLQSGMIYFAPSQYHLLIEESGCFSYSRDDKVMYSRPSIDVLFDSAALVFDDKVIAVLLSGANHDGRDGIIKVKARGGLAVVEDPFTAHTKTMPQAAINTGCIDIISSIKNMPQSIADAINEKMLRKLDE